MPKHDEPKPPKVKGFDDLALLSRILPGRFPDNLVGQKVNMTVKRHG